MTRYTTYTFSLPFKYSHATLPFPPDVESLFSSISKLREEKNTSPSQSLLKNVNIGDYSTPTSATLHKSLLNSDGICLYNIPPRIHLNRVGF